MSDKTQNDKPIKLQRLIELNKTALHGKVVCTGSSLMEMFPVEKFADELGDGTVIYNRSIGGYVTEELLEHIHEMVTYIEPNKVFINIGTNDLSDSRRQLSDIMERYDKILNEIEETVPNVRIYIMAYFPINYDAASEAMKPCLRVRTNEKINMANECLKELADKKHNRIYIDINNGLKDDKGRLKAEYTYEGMHIKEIGYRAIFDEFVKYVNEP